MEHPIIDVDSHVLEPIGLWQEYLEPEYRDRAIRWARDDRGLEYMEIDGRPAKQFMLRNGWLGSPLTPGQRPFEDRIKTTLGQPYRRVFLQEAMLEGRDMAESWSTVARASTNDGKGVCFISHIGEIYPSGFLPVSSGNVRRRSVVDAYRFDPVFQALRDPDRLKGKCGRCPFRAVCGGCRARAYAYTGDYLAPEPFCVFEPDAQEAVASGGQSRPGGW